MQHLYLIDIAQGYLTTALLTAAAYARPASDVLLIQGAPDYPLVRQALERFRPAEVFATAGCLPAIGDDLSLGVTPMPSDQASLLSWLIDSAVETAQGVVLFPAHSPSWAVKAASLAARLGYLAWPLEEAGGFAFAAPPNLEVLVLGEAPGALTDALQGRPYRHLAGDRAVAQYLQERRLPVDYVVLVNTADLDPPTHSAASMGTAWIRGLSLLAPVLASYRSALVLDARSPRPDSLEIERTLNQKVADAGLTPEYLAILASPGAIPFIYEPQVSFGGGEDATRDIHLRHNRDLFFDCAEGRLFGQTAGKVALQILSTKYHSDLEGPHRKRALIFSRPHVESGVTFAIDEAVGRTQLKPMLEKAGLLATELYGQDCCPSMIAEALTTAGLAMYGGHGSPESLSTHQAPLYAEFLPERVAPGVVYACACSTMHPRPNRYTSDGGFSFEEESTPFAEQIGPAFVDRGALAFVGGLTVEDVLLNTPMYVVFAQALVLKGLSVGHAVRAARNHSLTHLAALSQKAPEAYSNYRNGLANAVQQQIVLGDPAFAPYPGTQAARLPVRHSADEDAVTVTVTLPEENWLRQTVTVDESKPNRDFHRARSLQAWIPFGEDLVTWGETYTVAKDAKDVSDKAVMSGYIHLTADLPAGRAPTSLTLEMATAAPWECLLCGHGEGVANAAALLRKYVIPFQGDKPPVDHDQTPGWAFATEETKTGLRVHWLVPALVVEDAARRAVQLRSATFVLKHAPGVRAEGRLELVHGQMGKGAPGALEGAQGSLPGDLLLSFTTEEGGKGATIAQALAAPGGRWSCWLPADSTLHLKADLPMPVYRHVRDAVLSFRPDALGPVRPSGGPAVSTLKAPESGTLRGVVVDAFSGRPLPAARVRIWRGKQGAKAPVYEGYIGEFRADAQGRFEVSVPAGSCLVAGAQRTDQRYFAGKGAATVYAGREAHVLLSMEPGAVVTGRLTFQGAYTPKHAGVRLIELGSKDETIVAGGRTRRDGNFEVLAPVTKPFAFLIQTEGFKRILDDNGGKGYHLSPGKTLHKEFTVEGD